METRSYTVTGMTCQHCVASVSEELGEVPGVDGVEVDLSTGTVTVVLSQSVGDAAIQAAVEEAGYKIT